jgi:hypothetical protein
MPKDKCQYWVILCLQQNLQDLMLKGVNRTGDRRQAFVCEKTLHHSICHACHFNSTYLLECLEESTAHLTGSCVRKTAMPQQARFACHFVFTCHCNSTYILTLCDGERSRKVRWRAVVSVKRRCPDKRLFVSYSQCNNTYSLWCWEKSTAISMWLCRWEDWCHNSCLFVAIAPPTVLTVFNVQSSPQHMRRTFPIIMSMPPYLHTLLLRGVNSTCGGQTCIWDDEVQNKRWF